MDCGQWAGEAVITTDVSQTVGLTGGVKREKTPSRRSDLRERVGLARTESHSLPTGERKVPSTRSYARISTEAYK